MGLRVKTPVILILTDFVAAIAVLAALLMTLFYAPVELVMGQVQKVFYFHVAAGWTGMLGFLIAVISGVYYLKTRLEKWDAAGIAGIEIGMVFAALNIISGSIWARPIWNTWWTWDPRLTTALIMELIYAAYFILRNSVDQPERKARFGAVYAIIGFLSVPLTFISIRIFRTIHPVLIGSGDPSASGVFDMSSSMLQTFLFSLFAFTILFIALFWHRFRLEIKQKEIKSQEFIELKDGDVYDS